MVVCEVIPRPKYSETGELVSRSTGAKGEVPQAPANRSAASHEGEEHLVRHHAAISRGRPTFSEFL